MEKVAADAAVAAPVASGGPATEAAALALEKPVPWGPRSEAGKAARNKKKKAKEKARRKARAGSSEGRGATRVT